MSLQIKIRQKNLQRARERSENFKGNKSTFSKGRQIYGFLSEEIFIDNFGGELIDNRDFDVWVEGLGAIDLKTKVCKSEPKPEYMCSVAAYQIKNKTDYYAFFRTLSDQSVTWFLGIISKEKFLEEAELIKKGTREGPFVHKVDTYSVPISKLDSFHEVCRSKRS
jgi:hypothetical protein